LPIFLETQAKLSIQKMIKYGKIDLAWSFILDFKNSVNPDETVKREIFTGVIFSVTNLAEVGGILRSQRQRLQKKRLEEFSAANGSGCRSQHPTLSVVIITPFDHRPPPLCRGGVLSQVSSFGYRDLKTP